jgi:hypothetical protein
LDDRYEGGGEQLDTQPQDSKLAARQPVKIEKQIDSDPDRQDAKQRSATDQALVDRINRSDRWMIGLTAVIAIGGLISAGIFAWQLSVMQTESANSERRMLAAQRPWVMIDKIEVTSGDNASLPLNLSLKLLGQSPPANIEFAAVLLASVPENPHDYVTLGEPPRSDTCPATPLVWELADAAVGDKPRATVTARPDGSFVPKALVVCARYDWRLNKGYKGHVVMLYQVTGKPTKSRLNLLANYAG